MSSRVLKDPAVRRQEILDTAMVLFYEKGYDATSIADIAKAMNVVPGLCYRYFSNKKEIFDEAVKQYAVESCQDFLEVLRDQTKSFKELLDGFGQIMINKEENSRHHQFYHAPSNETFHLQLGIEMFHQLAPHISKALARYQEKGEIKVENPRLMTDFLLYGQIPLWMPPMEDTHSPEFQSKLNQIREYIYKLLEVKE